MITGHIFYQLSFIQNWFQILSNLKAIFMCHSSIIIILSDERSVSDFLIIINISSLNCEVKLT